MRRSPWAHHHGASAQFSVFFLFFFFGLVPGEPSPWATPTPPTPHITSFFAGRQGDLGLEPVGGGSVRSDRPDAPNYCIGSPARLPWL